MFYLICIINGSLRLECELNTFFKLYHRIGMITIWANKSIYEIFIHVAADTADYHAISCIDDKRIAFLNAFYFMSR